MNRGKAKAILHDYENAILDFNQVITLESDNSKAFLLRGLANVALDNVNDGCLDLSKAGELGKTEAYDLIKRLCN